MKKGNLLLVMLIAVTTSFLACKKEPDTKYFKSNNPYRNAQHYHVSGTVSYWTPNTGSRIDPVLGDTITIIDSGGGLYLTAPHLCIDQVSLASGVSPCVAGANCFAGSQTTYCARVANYDVTFPWLSRDSIFSHITLTGGGLGGGFSEYYTLSGTRF